LQKNTSKYFYCWQNQQQKQQNLHTYKKVSLRTTNGVASTKKTPPLHSLTIHPLFPITIPFSYPFPDLLFHPTPFAILYPNSPHPSLYKDPSFSPRTACFPLSPSHISIYSTLLPPHTQPLYSLDPLPYPKLPLVKLLSIPHLSAPLNSPKIPHASRPFPHAPSPPPLPSPANP
jgi:hypothetical protein